LLEKGIDKLTVVWYDTGNEGRKPQTERRQNMKVYRTERGVVTIAKQDKWTELKGFKVLRHKEKGVYDYVYGDHPIWGTPYQGGWEVTASYAYVGGAWRRYEFHDGKWVRVK